jgi:hypothetical protein
MKQSNKKYGLMKKWIMDGCECTSLPLWAPYPAIVPVPLLPADTAAAPLPDTEPAAEAAEALALARTALPPDSTAVSRVPVPLFPVLAAPLRMLPVPKPSKGPTSLDEPSTVCSIARRISQRPLGIWSRIESETKRKGRRT